MTASAIVADVLLGLAVLLVMACSVGVLVMRDTYQRLHFVGPISMAAPVLVALAVSVRSGWVVNTGETWLAIGLVALSAPFLTHATVRAIRHRERGDWRVLGPDGGQSRPETVMRTGEGRE